MMWYHFSALCREAHDVSVSVPIVAGIKFGTLFKTVYARLLHLKETLFFVFHTSI